MIAENETRENAFRLWLRQFVCGLTGHDELMKFENDRLALRCMSCGHESPGWNLNEAPPTVTARADRSVRRQSLLAARRFLA